jgi:hypothetical protein
MNKKVILFEKIVTAKMGKKVKFFLKLKKKKLFHLGKIILQKA